MRTYPALRQFHLLAGLCVSPFLVVFALSVFFLVHSWLPGTRPEPNTRTVTGFALPPDLESRRGREQIAALRTVLDALAVRGEIGFVRFSPSARRFNLPVTVPGRETAVELHVATSTARIVTRATGVADAMISLHKMPGPHNVAIRGNSLHVQIWRWLADATTCLLLAVTASGVYLWAMLRAERPVGLVLLAAGALSLGGLLHALLA